MRPLSLRVLTRPYITFSNLDNSLLLLVFLLILGVTTNAQSYLDTITKQVGTDLERNIKYLQF